MGKLLFLGRAAFICNLFFVICLLLRHTHFKIPIALNEFVIIVGWVLSVVLNAIFVVSAVAMFAIKKRLLLPTWLITINTVFFLFQITYRFIFTF